MEIDCIPALMAKTSICNYRDNSTHCTPSDSAGCIFHDAADASSASTARLANMRPGPLHRAILCSASYSVACSGAPNRISVTCAMSFLHGSYSG